MKNLDEKDIRKVIKGFLKEKYEGGHFDEFEFDNNAKQAAIADIKGSGEDFEELGTSKFEKDPEFKEKFKSALKQTNLGLSSDEKEVERLAQAIKNKKSHEKKFGVGSMNENELPHGDHPDGFTFDTTSLYKYLKDALWQLKNYDYSVAAEVLEAAMNRDFDINKKGISAFSVNEADFPELMKQFKDNMEKEMTPKEPSNETPEEKQKRISVELARLKAKEKERQKEAGEDTMEESNIRSHANGRGQNLKPKNYPKPFKRDALREGFEENKIKDAEMLFAKLQDEANYLIYKKINHKITGLEDRKLEKLNREIEKMGDEYLGVLDFNYIKKYEMMFAKQRNDEDYIDYLESAEADFEHGFNNSDELEIDESELKSEDYDFAGEERAFHNKQNFEDEMNQEVYFVVDNDFNKAHYLDLIGQTFEEPPAYAQVKLIKKGESIDTPRTLGDNDVQEDSSDSLANKHGENVKPETIDEVTDTERYEQVVTLDGSEAAHALNILMQDGKDDAMEYLKQWHQPGQGMGSNTLGHGSMDKTYEKDGYIMNWNSSLGYIGLVHDTEYGKNMDEDSQLMRHRVDQRQKDAPLGQHAPHSQQAKK